MIHSYLPSPSQGVWHLGPVPLRAYALCILLGIAIAIAVGNRRFIARGGIDAQVADVAMWAVPFGVIGGRVYHVLTDWETYFGTAGKGFMASLRIWEGGLGIWGALLLGGVGAYIGCVRQGIPLPAFADAVAPGIAFAQASGRWGNWFNQELFGKPTSVPWALKIDPAFRPLGFEQYSTFHPTFLYESIWCIAIGFTVIWADKRFTLGHGRAFALYVAAYCAGRGAIESMRIDEARHILGIRFNVFTALVVGFLALAYIVRSFERSPGREVLVSGRLASAAQRAEFEAKADSKPIEKKPASRAKREAPRRARTTSSNTVAKDSSATKPATSDKDKPADEQVTPAVVADEVNVQADEQSDEHIARFEELLAALSEPVASVERVKAPVLSEILEAVEKAPKSADDSVATDQASLSDDDEVADSANDDAVDSVDEDTQVPGGSNAATSTSPSTPPIRGRRAKPKKRW